MQPRVLIICERAAERETIRVLVGTMGCQWVLASSIEEALANLKEALELYVEDMPLPEDMESPIIATVELSA